MICTLWTMFHGRFYARNLFIHIMRYDGTTIDDIYTAWCISRENFHSVIFPLCVLSPEGSFHNVVIYIIVTRHDWSNIMSSNNQQCRHLVFLDTNQYVKNVVLPVFEAARDVKVLMKVLVPMYDTPLESEALLPGMLDIIPVHVMTSDDLQGRIPGSSPITKSIYANMSSRFKTVSSSILQHWWMHEPESLSIMGHGMLYRPIGRKIGTGLNSTLSEIDRYLSINLATCLYLVWI